MSEFTKFSAFLESGALDRAKGPVAIILIEDDSAVQATLAHHIKLGFPTILALSLSPLAADQIPAGKTDVINLSYPTRQDCAHVAAVNAVIDRVPADTWLYYCYNAEFLFFPFSETRSIGELLAFIAEERRRAMLTYVIDLYAGDLTDCPDAVSLSHAEFDRTGYYALGRKNRHGDVLDRQLDFHGGLRWRFEEHVPADRRRIDRVGLFRTEKGLRALPDHRLNIEEYNTYSCRWHNNPTCAITSFRVAKALAGNPGSRRDIADFRWRNSHSFRWNSQQLMDLGLMEPGQWF